MNRTYRPFLQLCRAPTAAVPMALAVGLLLSGCWFDTQTTRLNKHIDRGEAAQALTELETEITTAPTDSAFNLLAIKARLALCLQRECYKEGPTPQLLRPIEAHARHVTQPLLLGKKEPPLTLASVYQHATGGFTAAAQQPAAVVALYSTAPASLQPPMQATLFQPALAGLRSGAAKPAAAMLAALGQPKDPPLPAALSYTAHLLAAITRGESLATNPALIALRSVTAPPLPATAAASFPWAMAQTVTPSHVLATLPAQLESLQFGAYLTPAALSAMAEELVTASRQPAALAQWQQHSTLSASQVSLLLQRSALSLDPNQPQLWATYLPTLVSATLLTSPSATAGTEDNLQFTASRITSSSAPLLVGHILPAVRQLQNYPSVAAPLLTFAGQLELSRPQQLEYEKISQDLLLKAAAQGDVSTTLLLAQNLPAVVQNNRHSVIPLLVKYIRDNLRAGQFEAATNTANLLTQTLQMDIEFNALILEEFNDALKRQNVTEALKAPTADVLLLPEDEAMLDLGPLFTFMQQHFATQPKVISAQLTTLIATAPGTYGQPASMYRLGGYFPSSTLSLEQQEKWLGAALEEALIVDTALSPPQLAANAAALAQLHPGLNLAPVLEVALKRATTPEGRQQIWHNATPQVKEVLRAIRPEFVRLMQGIDALAAERLNTAAQAFTELTEPLWLTEAHPYLSQFHQRLIGLSGVYIPLSGAASFPTAAIVLAPQGLGGGKLNQVSATFLSRGGLHTVQETSLMRTNNMAVYRFALPLPYDFDSQALPLNPDTIARLPQGGNFEANFGALRSLTLQQADPPLLNVTAADGTTTLFMQALVNPAEALRPDGTYLMQAWLGGKPTTTAAILPPGSMLTLQTRSGLQPPTPGADTSSTLVYPVTGWVRHPGNGREIELTGFFEPETLLTTFTFNYPLPSSGQPAKAVVRCQTLAGPITCGMHNANSTRQAYGAHITGMQTQESLASAALLRQKANAAARSSLLPKAQAVPEQQQEPLPATPSATISSTTPEATPAISPTQPTEATPPEDTVPTTSPTISEDPAPGAFINNSGTRFTTPTEVSYTESEAPPGMFIDLTGRNTSASPTTPSPTAAE